MKYASSSEAFAVMLEAIPASFMYDDRITGYEWNPIGLGARLSLGFRFCQLVTDEYCGRGRFPELPIIFMSEWKLNRLRHQSTKINLALLSAFRTFVLLYRNSTKED